MKTRVGYTGGTTKNPTYHSIGDHTETVALDFDPDQITYEKLLQKFWKSHNPYTQHRNQYMSAIFYHNQSQKHLAETSRDELQKESARPVVTKIMPSETFYDAEDYHQKYMLRQHFTFLDGLKMSNEELITSHIAAKLNGYFGGFGDVEDFEKERKDLGLSQKQADYVIEQIKRKRRY